MLKGIVVLGACLHMITAWTEPSSYTTQVKFYSVKEDIQLRYSSGHVANGINFVQSMDEIESALEKPIGISFGNVHIVDILQEISMNYAVVFVLDSDAVQPEQEIQALGTEPNYVTIGQVNYQFNALNTRLAQSLKAILRPLGLCYRVYPGFIFITANRSDEELQKMEPPELDSGVYRVIDGNVVPDQLVMGETTLHMDGADLSWTGLPVTENDAIRLVSAPSLQSHPEVEVSIKISQELPVAYFELVEEKKGRGKRDSSREQGAIAVGETFTYQQTLMESSVTLMMTLHENQEDILDLEYDIHFVLIGDYRHSEKVDFPIGKPDVRTINGKGIVQLEMGKWSARWIPSDEENFMLMLFKVEGVPSE